MVSVEASESTWLTNNERMAVRTKVGEKMRGTLVFAIEEAICRLVDEELNYYSGKWTL
jgi:hypothetical protein